MADVRLKISPPWITYLNKLNALFGNDPDITVEYDNDQHEIKLFVDNAKKASALEILLPQEKVFGNIVLFITVIPANGYGDIINPSVKELFDIAFDRNPVYAFSKTINGLWSYDCTYIVFKNRVVQFFNDNLNDLYGNVSTLYQDIAEQIFADNDFYGVAYCTDIEEKVGKPLGEWP